MKLGISRLLALLVVGLGVLACLSAPRTFGGTPRPTAPYYAEVAFRAENVGRTPFRSHARIWCRDLDHYRVELADWPGEGLCTYLVRSGRSVYTAVGRTERPEGTRWMCCPTFWMGQDVLRQEFGRQWRMRDATLVGIERIQGLRVEHWRGYRVWSKQSTESHLDVWLSTDARFPYLLRAESASRRGRVLWEVTRLRVDAAVPSGLLSAQVRPEGRLWAQMQMRYKPLWMVLVWYALILLAYGMLVRAIAGSGSPSRRYLIGAAGTLACFGLLWIAPPVTQLVNDLFSLPVLVLIGCAAAAALSYWIRRFGMPSHPRLLAGTRWHVAVWAPAACLVGLAISTGQTHDAYLRQYGIALRGAPFLPQTLLTVAVFAAIWAAVEEVVFRGYVTGALKRRFSSAVLVNLLQALPFTVGHAPRILQSHYTGSQTVAAFGSIFVFGLIFGALRLRYDNLGTPWLVHTAYNIGALYAANAAIYSSLHSL